MNLTAEQAAACYSDHERVLVVAGAGSGKTRELTARVVRAVDAGTDPNRILCVTFTNRAADEMRERIETATAGRVPEVRTLHSWCAALLRANAALIGRTPRFVILDETDAEGTVREAARLTGDDMADRSSVETLLKKPRVLARYRDLLREANAVDFDMLEGEVVRLLRDNRDLRDRVARLYDLVLIDEFQDTNLSQVFILEALSGIWTTRVHEVGDPRQGIYRFRGAEVRTIVQRAQEADVDVHHLTTCYRCPAPVVGLANALQPDWPPLRPADERRSPGTLVAGVFDLETAGVLERVRQLVERGAELDKIAVLVRTWDEGEAAVRTLRCSGVQATLLRKTTDAWGSDAARQLVRAVQLVLDPTNGWLASHLADWGREATPAWPSPRALADLATSQGRTVIALLASLDNRWRDFDARLRDLRTRGGKIQAAEAARIAVDALDVAARYRSSARPGQADALDVLVADLARRNLPAHEVGAWWAIRSHADRTVKAEGVNVLTVHAAKGLEYDHVIVTGAMDGAYPTDRKRATQDDRDEDMRVLYVAVTRTRRTLTLLRPSVRTPRYGDAADSRPPPLTESVRWDVPRPPPWGGSTPWGPP